MRPTRRERTCLIGWFHAPTRFCNSACVLVRGGKYAHRVDAGGTAPGGCFQTTSAGARPRAAGGRRSSARAATLLRDDAGRLALVEIGGPLAREDVPGQRGVGCALLGRRRVVAGNERDREESEYHIKPLGHPRPARCTQADKRARTTKKAAVATAPSTAMIFAAPPLVEVSHGIFGPGSAGQAGPASSRASRSSTVQVSSPRAGAITRTTMLRMRPPTASARNSCSMSAADVGTCAERDPRAVVYCVSESLSVWGSLFGSGLQRGLAGNAKVLRAASQLVASGCLCPWLRRQLKLTDTLSDQGAIYVGVKGLVSYAR